MDKIKWLSPNQDFVQKSRWPYFMQSKFWMDKIKEFLKSSSKSLLKSHDGHILCRVNLEWTKYRGVIKMEW